MMNQFDLEDIRDKLEDDLQKQVVSSRVLLDRLRLIDEDSRKTAAYLDPNYAGFYYHLGKYIKPQNVIEFGFNLGLLTGCLFASCKTVKTFLALNKTKEDFIASRIGRSNIKLRFKGKSIYYCGSLFDRDFDKHVSKKSWDLIIINDEAGYDEHLQYLDFSWNCLGENGCIVSDYLNRHEPAKSAFVAFCESKTRKPVFFKTRYGTGIVQK
jgi:hypothetical protein